MSDLVVTVPKGFWPEWIAEGDAAGDPETGEEWAFFVGRRRPPIAPGERLYIVAHERLRGWAPVRAVRVLNASTEFQQWAICRRGGAVACTIPERIPGFRGCRRPWWPRALERPFPDWKTADVPPALWPADEKEGLTMAQLRFERPETTEKFAASLREQRVELPVNLCSTNCGVIVDAQGRDVCTVDVNAERPDLEVQAIAMWIVCALNTCGGFQAVQPAAAAPPEAGP